MLRAALGPSLPAQPTLAKEEGSGSVWGTASTPPALPEHAVSHQPDVGAQAEQKHSGLAAQPHPACAQPPH